MNIANSLPESVGYPKKRARTRGRLLTAGMVVLARRGPDGATVGEIAGEAGVAPGTFYNHFPSLIDLVETITAELQTGVEIASSTLESIDHDPSARVAIGTFQLLSLTRNDSAAAAAFVALLASIPTFRERIRNVVGQTVSAGVEVGDFHVADPFAATDAVLGAITQWIRTDLVNEAPGAANEDRALLVLRLLGVQTDAAVAVIEAVMEPS